MPQPNILLLATDDSESTSLQRALNEYVALRKLGDVRELEGELKAGNYDAVLCGWSFHWGRWSDVLLQVQDRCPDVPVIVFNRAGGEREWLDVLNAGGFDLLVPPYDRRSVLSVVEHAIASHSARMSRKGPALIESPPGRTPRVAAARSVNELS